MDTKVKFLDENHGRYIILGKQPQFSKEDLPITEKRNDHTFIITFKKKRNMRIKLLVIIVTAFQLTNSAYIINHKRLEFEADTYQHRIWPSVP